MTPHSPTSRTSWAATWTTPATTPLAPPRGLTPTLSAKTEGAPEQGMRKRRRWWRINEGVHYNKDYLRWGGGKHITSNYLIEGLTVFLQRHVCEMDLETSEKVMASFLFLSCSPPSSFFVLPFSGFFLDLDQIYSSDLHLPHLAVQAVKHSSCVVFVFRKARTLWYNFDVFQNFALLLKRRRTVFVWIMLYLECILL